jgi:hypothetical protein
MALILSIGVVMLGLNLLMTIEYPAQIATLSAPYGLRLRERLCSCIFLFFLLLSTPIFAERAIEILKP